MTFDNYPEGIIQPGDELAMNIGFSADRFDGYLWKEKGRIMISMIISKQPKLGHMNELFAAIEDLGFEIAVPTPLGLMEHILEKKGFHQTVEIDPDFGAVEVWIK